MSETVRTAVLAETVDSQARARLSAYAPGSHQRNHRHERPHASFVLAGSFLEQSPYAEVELRNGSAILRADDASHAVRFGPAGALIVSFEVPMEAVRPCNRSGHALFRSPSGLGELLLAFDIPKTALQTLAIRSARHQPPQWLVAMASELLARPWGANVSEHSDGIGRDRSAVSRSFLRHFGVPPSIFRRRAMVAHALSLLLFDEECASQAALGAGFTDQSHMTRAVKATCGMPPGKIASILDKSHPCNR